MSSHAHDLSALRHSHAYVDAGARQRERALLAVVVLTLVTMVVELLAGWWTRSLALTADGWHMGTHALALGGALLAYRLSARASARRAVPGGDAGFAFGGWKIEVLAAYTSGLALAVVALWLAVDAVQALKSPRTIAYGEAAAVAAIGLAVNLVSAWLLARGAQGDAQTSAHGATDGHAHNHAHAHGHAHGHGHGHGHDHNFNAAYLHVLADALTSVLALVALAGGAWYGWAWLDPAVALVGALVIGQWAVGTLRGSARALVDATEDPALVQRLHELIETDGDVKLVDVHVWQVGTRAWCAALSVVADAPRPASEYRARLAELVQLRHVTVEVHRCHKEH